MMAEVKRAQRQISLNDITFNKENALMAAVSCIPIVGAVVFFVEKKDLFVRYYAAQYGLLFVAGLALGVLSGFIGLIPVINILYALVAVCISPLLGLAGFILVIMGALKAYKGERFDIPVISGWALRLMSQM
jgi:uncharacterized membrane protein